jgi:hypothetical protein
MRLIFVVLVILLVVVSAVTRARPRTAGVWTLVWVLLVFLAWHSSASGGFEARNAVRRQLTEHDPQFDPRNRD